MQVTVEETGVIERKLTVSVPSEEVVTEVDRRLRDVSRQAKIPGFRPGKAPMSVIEKQYSGRVTNEVISAKIQDSYHKALTREQITPAGLVSIDPVPYESGKDLEYTVTVDVFPEIATVSLSGVAIEKPVCKVVDEDVERTIEDLRKRNATFGEKEGVAETGDRVTIDFDGRVGGESFAGGTATDFPFVLGEGQMLEEFEACVAGASAGETRTVEFTFPEDYRESELAGKEVNFEVTVRKVEQSELPELNEAFAEDLGISEGGMDKMREEVRASLERELAGRLRSTMRDRVMEALHQVNDVEVPRTLVEEEVDRAVEAISRQVKPQGIPSDDIDRGRFAEVARKRVALGLIARAVITANEIEADDSSVRSRVEEMAQEYPDADEFVNYYYSDPGRIQQVEAMVLEEQLVSTMLASADVREVEVGFREFMNPETA